MTTSTRIFSLGTIFALILSACTLFNNTSTTPGNNPVQPIQPTPVPGVSMIVSYDTAIPYNAVDQVINYTYTIGNTSGTSLAGPVSVVDDRMTVTCPDVTTVGNADGNLDGDETLSCSGSYTIVQLDLNAGSVSNTATASAGGQFSSAVITTVPLTQTRALTLTKSADPNTYNSAGQNIIYSYVITNSGNVTLGPAQFTISDDKIGTAFNCGGDATTLDPNATVTCSATYVTTDADLTVGTVVNSASASDGSTSSNIVTATINKGTVQNPSNLTPGSTINHQVVSGEWLWQIARCYGADPKQIVLANPQLPIPARITPGITVSVPSIGAGGRTIYGPPCVGTHTVQSGETWASIASLYNASVIVLQDVNPGSLSPGRVLKVPLNSAGNP